MQGLLIYGMECPVTRLKIPKKKNTNSAENKLPLNCNITLVVQALIIGAKRLDIPLQPENREMAMRLGRLSGTAEAITPEYIEV